MKSPLWKAAKDVLSRKMSVEDFLELAEEWIRRSESEDPQSVWRERQVARYDWPKGVVDWDVPPIWYFWRNQNGSSRRQSSYDRSRKFIKIPRLRIRPANLQIRLVFGRTCRKSFRRIALD